ncbi:MAG: C-terminal helicase domain-containing protein, partial [Burkholderiaceae bacterium]
RNASAENVEQTIYRVRDAGSKRAAVAQIIRDKALSQVIVFTNTKIGASRLARELERDGLVASAIHGDKSQHERLATLEAFKQGEVKVLVATDVAARGLDIAELPAVINYDLPFSPEDYVHRIGRTGRAGASGLAISLMLNDDERLRADISKLIKHDLKPVDLMVTGASPAARSDRPERGERNERTERADRGARSTRRSPSTRSSSDNNAGNARSVPGYSSDPFFFKPYEEKARSEAEVEAAAASTDEKSIAALSTKRRTAGRSGQLPALLGGLKKATS